ncbi:MAG: beta-lactamase family protein [Rhodoferax sp.]|nr:beta-lactamase family protein [Rhodoferax sp.]
MRKSRNASLTRWLSTLLACGGALAQGPVAAPFAEVERTITEAYSATESNFGMAVHVYDRQDRLVYGYTTGDFHPDKFVPVASASKIVTGILILSLVQQGELSLGATTQQVLGWSGEKGTITLRQLLGQVSGLKPSASCVNDVKTTLTACVDAIRDDASALVHSPGTHFDYGSSHFHVAARMAEVATGRNWNTLFSETLSRPLGLSPQTTFYTSPWLGRVGAGEDNPRAAGGLVASLRDYAKLLAIPFHHGEFSGRQFMSAELAAVMGTEPNPLASVGGSPMARATGKPIRYGLGAWVECLPAQPECPVLSSAGAFGWTPWMDRESGYYAVIAMFRPPGGGSAAAGVVDFSVQLQQRLKPLLSAAMTVRSAGRLEGARPFKPPE